VGRKKQKLMFNTLGGGGGEACGRIALGKHGTCERIILNRILRTNEILCDGSGKD
jgi:hypothetical protein